MSVAAIGIGVSVAAGVAGSVMSAEAQRKASSQAAESQRDTNNLNYKMWLEGRGSQGNAFLPLYFQSPDGTPFEGDVLAKDAMDAYYAGRVDPYARYADYQQTIDPYLQSSEQAYAQALGLIDGTVRQKELQYQQPVIDMRRNQAGVYVSAAEDALQRQLGDIRAARALQGFSGDSLAANRLSLDARNQAATKGALALSEADLQNAIDIRDINTNDMTRAIQNAQLPAQLAEANLQLKQLPDKYMANAQQLQLSAMQPFNIGTGNFTYQPLPPPVPNQTGAAVLSGVSQGASGLTGYLQNQKAIDALNTRNTSNQLTQAGMQTPSNFGSLNNYWQNEYVNSALRNQYVNPSDFE